MFCKRVAFYFTNNHDRNIFKHVLEPSTSRR